MGKDVSLVDPGKARLAVQKHCSLQTLAGLLIPAGHAQGCTQVGPYESVARCQSKRCPKCLYGLWQKVEVLKGEAKVNPGRACKRIYLKGPQVASFGLLCSS